MEEPPGPHSRAGTTEFLIYNTACSNGTALHPAPSTVTALPCQEVFGDSLVPSSPEFSPGSSQNVPTLITAFHLFVLTQQVFHHHTVFYLFLLVGVSMAKFLQVLTHS